MVAAPARAIVESLIGEISLTTRSRPTEVLEDGAPPGAAARARRRRADLAQCAENLRADALPGEPADPAMQGLERWNPACDLFDAAPRRALNLVVGGPR
jgi:hypothetical protein